MFIRININYKSNQANRVGMKIPRFSICGLIKRSQRHCLGDQAKLICCGGDQLITESCATYYDPAFIYGRDREA